MVKILGYPFFMPFYPLSRLRNQSKGVPMNPNKITLQNDWLTPKELNDIYKFSTSTLAKWRMKKINLPFSKMGKYIKYKRSDIEAFIESNKVEVD